MVIINEKDLWDIVSQKVIPTEDEKIKMLLQKPTASKTLLYLEHQFVKMGQIDISFEQIRRTLFCDQSTLLRNISDMALLGLIKIIRSKFTLITPVRRPDGENMLTQYTKYSYSILLSDGSIDNIMKTTKVKKDKKDED